MSFGSRAGLAIWLTRDPAFEGGKNFVISTGVFMGLRPIHGDENRVDDFGSGLLSQNKR